MKLAWKLSRLAMFLVLLLAGTGCSGINASHSVSPLDFLLPGLGGFGQTQPSAATNSVTPSSFTPQAPAELLVQAN